MENAVEALKMAAAVMTFVLALGISISSFSQARETSEALLAYTDRETVTQYVEDSGNKERVVGKETIVPTIYRAYKENYKILFYNSDGTPIELYTKTENGVHGVVVNYIDLEKDVIGDDWQKDNFIMALLYGNKANLKRQDGTTMTFSQFSAELAQNNSRITLKSQGIYDTILKENTFLERFGVYYQEDLSTINTDTDISEEYEESETQDENKKKKRVISYTIYNE